MASPKIILYTNHNCPWAHRAHIALAELNLPFEEEIIDLSVPRTPEYLKINPRGLVPSISYNGEIITESAIVSQFLADAHPSHLLPVSNAEGGALRRARINFFVDTFFTKAFPLFIKSFSAPEEEVEGLGTQFAEIASKELEPLLSDAKPFFGGSDKLTLAEVLTGSFVIRVLTLPEKGVLPKSYVASLPEKAPNFYKWAQVVSAHPSVNGIYDVDTIAENTKNRIAKLRAQSK
ncbi:hypothetical protein SAPIO_CDS10746 [Scedosporium apiospermum]|uniref:Glutathione S-transferase domain-containing protein n=1 Tax=Pseudallescheria apiosperma TaxID=563466 RepID=A0A084FUF8_PSEDA|nr:uncharacterized protein SAPIO_CDS10746 [Scedosporium apiospermum]KEZ38720.1 hypothetical protein SAPIO_CDS10746 [Scedosporium apiospermum]